MFLSELKLAMNIAVVKLMFMRLVSWCHWRHKVLPW